MCRPLDKPLIPHADGDQADFDSEIERDDDEVTEQVDAGGALHWAPVHHAGLRSRAAAISRT